MSLRIIKAGILDTIQDAGRFGAQGTGINPNGAMDLFAARLANCLVGNSMDTPVIEMHFPGPVIQFEQSAIISLAGADFNATINGKEIGLNQPVVVGKGSKLQFTKAKKGARCYCSFLNKMSIGKWLNSYSTNLKAAVGGLQGGSLKTGDVIPFENLPGINDLATNATSKVLPWKAIPPGTIDAKIEVIKGPEWDWLDEASKEVFIKSKFKISTVADRMGYRLNGVPLHLKEAKQLLSSSVCFGTLQLLPNGQLIVLMADHQTTGGYPRVANIISAHLAYVAQSKPNDSLSFEFIDVEMAEQKLLDQYNYLKLVQQAASFKIEKLLQ